MRKKDKLAREQLRLLMLSNHPPGMDPVRRRSQISRLTAEALKTDYLYQPSFPERMLAVISWFTPWIWLLQAGFLALLFFYAHSGLHDPVAFLVTALAPCLTLVLLYELSKSFSNNMWEMEAACRFNLPRLFFLRLCILSGTDLAVLGAALAAFRMTGGMLWQFALYTLLPFFLMSSLCLWLLQHFGNRYGRTALLTVSLSGGCIWSILLMILQSLIPRLEEHLLRRTVFRATLGALVLFLACAFRLCTKKYYGNNDNRKENKAWSFE